MLIAGNHASSNTLTGEHLSVLYSACVFRKSAGLCAVSAMLSGPSRKFAKWRF